MKFEAGKEYRTRAGGKARIYATDGAGSHLIHGAVLTDRGWLLLARWKADGRYHASSNVDHGYDLMLAPDPIFNAALTPGIYVTAFRHKKDAKAMLWLEKPSYTPVGWVGADPRVLVNKNPWTLAQPLVSFPPGCLENRRPEDCIWKVPEPELTCEIGMDEVQELADHIANAEVQR